MTTRLWIHMGLSEHPESSLPGFIDVPDAEVDARKAAVATLGGKLLGEQPI